MNLIESVMVRKAPVMGDSKIFVYFDNYLGNFKFIVTRDLSLAKFIAYVKDSSKINYMMIYRRGHPINHHEDDELIVLNEQEITNSIKATTVNKTLKGEFELTPDMLFYLIEHFGDERIEPVVLYTKEDLIFEDFKFDKLEILNDTLIREGHKSEIINYNNTSKVIKVVKEEDNELYKYILFPRGNKIMLYFVGDKPKAILYKNLNILPHKEFAFHEIELLLMRLEI